LWSINAARISSKYKHCSDQSSLSPTTITGCEQRYWVDSPNEPIMVMMDGGRGGRGTVRRTTDGGKGDSSVHHPTTGPITDSISSDVKLISRHVFIYSSHNIQGNIQKVFVLCFFHHLNLNQTLRPDHDQPRFNHRVRVTTTIYSIIVCNNY